jgi:hypothetical protein
VIITFTLFLRGLTFIFTYGYVPSPVWTNLLPYEGVNPSIEDDFGVALLKLGTACMEATQYSGLRNELVGIEERSNPYLSLGTDKGEVMKPLAKIGGFNSEITDIQVSQLEQPHSRNAHSTWIWMDDHPIDASGQESSQALSIFLEAEMVVRTSTMDILATSRLG